MPAGDTDVVSADLTTLESLMMGEDEREKILGLAPTPAPYPRWPSVLLTPPRRHPLQHLLKIILSLVQLPILQVRESFGTQSKALLIRRPVASLVTPGTSSTTKWDAQFSPRKSGHERGCHRG